MKTRRAPVVDVADRIDPHAWADRVAEAARAAGLDAPSRATGRGVVTLQRGYSTVALHATGGIRVRREGGPRFETRLDVLAPDVVAQCVDVLAAGRTVECGRGVGLSSIVDFVHFQPADYPFMHLAKVIRDEDDPWDLDPDYQRGRVWTATQSERFVGSFLESDGRMPLIFLQEYGPRPREVLDGKQRLLALLAFLGGADLGREHALALLVLIDEEWGIDLDVLLARVGVLLNEREKDRLGRSHWPATLALLAIVAESPETEDHPAPDLGQPAARVPGQCTDCLTTDHCRARGTCWP